MQDAQEVASNNFTFEPLMPYREFAADKFMFYFAAIAKAVHKSAVEKGFWEPGTDRNNGEMIALIHSELGEMTEGLRHGNPPDDHIPAFSSAEAEAADAVIRLMDLCVARGWRLPEAIIAKMDYNSRRPYKHGKQF